MVKKAISGRGRRGAPPLPRQRGALRVVQVTLAGLAIFLSQLAYSSSSDEGAEPAEALVLFAVALICGGYAVWMGIRTVRGPQPPSLD